MIRFSKEHQDALRAIGVTAVYLFGSRVLGGAREDSDYDIGVVLSNPAAVADNQLDVYHKLYAMLAEYIPDEASGARPDISLLQFANAALEMAAIDGLVLFESNPKERVAYEEGVIERYDDYRYLRGIYEDATFAAFAPA